MPVFFQRAPISRRLHSLSLVWFLFSVLITKYLVFTNSFRITNIIIQGNKYIPNDVILETINKQTENKNILNVDFKMIKNSLYEYDFIYKTKIYIKIPSSIIIDISEVKPIGLLEDNGSIYFLSQDLKLINANYQSINHFSNTPVITNLNNHKIDLFKTREILQKIMFTDSSLYDKLNEIRFEDNQIILILDNYTTIILGNKNYDNSLNKFLEFNSQVIIKKDKKIENYKYINVSIPNQIVINENKLKI